MSQKNKGIYSLLSHTFFYSLVQKVMSATSFREKIVKKYITKHNVNVLDVGCGPDQILDTQIMATIVNGKIIYNQL